MIPPSPPRSKDDLFLTLVKILDWNDGTNIYVVEVGFLDGEQDFVVANLVRVEEDLIHEEGGRRKRGRKRAMVHGDN